ncbi:MAG: diguanylate cyclase [Rickettsiales bacterium]|nr:diguanylate cyclase [Rickettsiales bacterium]
MSAKEPALMQAEIELLQSYSHDVIYRLRYETMRYDYISPTIEKLLGFSAEEVMEINLRSLIEETRLVKEGLRPLESFEPHEDSRKRREVLKWQADYRMRTKDGRRIWVSDVSYPWFDASGAIIGSVGTLRDITERVEAEAQAVEAATRLRQVDPVTRFAARAVFFEKLDEELKRVKRSRQDVAVLALSIDGLDDITKNHGHAQSDRVLGEVADIMRQCLRDTDVAARLSENEMAVCLPETQAEGAFWVGERIREAVLHFQFSTQDQLLLAVTVSVGVAAARFDEPQNAQDMLKTAQSRLFIARHTGQNRVSIDELMNLH